MSIVWNFLLSVKSFVTQDLSGIFLPPRSADVTYEDAPWGVCGWPPSSDHVVSGLLHNDNTSSDKRGEGETLKIWIQGVQERDLEDILVFINLESYIELDIKLPNWKKGTRVPVDRNWRWPTKRRVPITPGGPQKWLTISGWPFNCA